MDPSSPVEELSGKLLEVKTEIASVTRQINDIELKLGRLQYLIAGRAEWTYEEPILFDDDVKLVRQHVFLLGHEKAHLQHQKAILLEMQLRIQDERILHADRQPSTKALADVIRVPPSVQHYHRALFHPKYVRPPSSQSASSSSSRLSTQLSEFATRVRKFYDVDRSYCMVAGQIDLSDHIGEQHCVKAAHLWDYRCRKALPTFHLTEQDIDNPRNGLPLCSEIEIAFGAGRVCFLYQPATRDVVFVVLDPDIKNKTASPSGSTFGDLHGTSLKFKNANRPFKRLLAYLAANSIAFASKKKSKSKK
ncbi:unnamed protein product (mitochondrion) [Plasmodiophora brassicae]|uniref:HNH nuclease domain-containing protein n=1 Tax=Plasmodiophora brassicae TaxID=37360 RepID=A0A0G4ISZ9_PLABS|nr:hypothetical protein PBRA_006335 [Plasmodiophora brassicae]SPQ95206.1 unnamed protein product [Plasmodiophora brassicae]